MTISYNFIILFNSGFTLLEFSSADQYLLIIILLFLLLLFIIDIYLFSSTYHYLTYNVK